MSDFNQQEPEEPADDSERPRRGYGWIVGLVVLLGLLPSLITILGQQQRVLTLLLPNLGDAVDFQSATLHWWEPVAVSEVSVRDLSGSETDESRQLLRAKRARTAQSLWNLVLSSSDPVNIVLLEPELNLRVADGTTNLEQTLERVFGPQESGDSGRNFTVAIENGRIRLFSTVGKDRGDAPAAIVDNITGQFSTSGKGILPALQLAATIGSEQSPADTIRAANDAASSGVNPRIAAALGEQSPDRLLLPYSEQEIAAATEHERPATINFEILAPEESGTDQQCRIDVHRVDLERIEPILQRLVPDSRWTGNISCRIEGLVAQKDGRGIAGRAFLSGTDVSFRHASWVEGEWIRLQQVNGTAAAAFADDGVFIRELKLNSSAVQISGRGEIQLRTPDPATVLKERAGREQGRESPETRAAKAATAGTVRIDMVTDAAAIAAMIPKTLHLGSDVQIQEAEIQTSCRLVSQLPADDLSMSNARPDTCRWQLAAATSPISATLNGRQIRIDPLMRLDANGTVSVDRILVGEVQLAGTPGDVTITPQKQGYQIEGSFHPRQLWQELSGLTDLPEPGISGPLSVSGYIEPGAHALALRDAEIRSPELTLLSRSLQIQSTGPLTARFRGDLSLEGNGSALKTLLKPWQETEWLSDASTVSINVEAANQRMHVRAAVEPQSGSFGPRDTDRKTESLQIEKGLISADLSHVDSAGTIQVHDATIKLPGISADLTGELYEVAGQLHTQLEAETEYDLEILTAWLMPSQAETMQLTGQHRTTLSLAGSPFLLTDGDVADLQRSHTHAENASPFQVNGELSWDGGRIAGLTIGSATTEIRLQNGRIRTAPVHCRLGTGELSALAQWDIRRNMLQMASGSRIENLDLTPELCGEWLGYVTPLLSDSANVSGRVSLRVQQCDVYPNNPERNEIAGQLSVQRGEALPGASLQALLQVLEVVRKKSLANRGISLPPQDVGVHMNGGLITHDRLEMDIADYRTVSSGSVGLDGQLQLLLEVPLERATVGRKGRSLRVPVGGTVGRPQLQIQGLLQNLGQQEIQNRLNREIDRGLEKLLEKL